MNEIPVYLFTGFMDSGKTSLIKDTLFEQGFAKEGKSLVICCEDGDAEFTDEELEKNNINIENVIIHAPYILNLAQSNEDKRSFAIRFLSSEMKTMAAVGAKYIVVHPGAHMHLGEEVGLELIADSLRQVLENTNFDNTYIALEELM